MPRQYYFPYWSVHMGTLEWVRCYWCNRWAYGPYVVDWIGAPLCDRCYDWHVENDGGPYEPSALTRCTTSVRNFFPTLPEAVARCIAEHLVSQWAP